MKNLIYLLIGLLMLNCSNQNNKKEIKSNLSLENSINVYCTQDLNLITSKWAKEFCLLNPNLKIEVINVSESITTANIGRSLHFISNEIYSELNDDSLRKIIVGRDVVVPIINSRNPFLDKIYQQGVSSEELAKIFRKTEMQKWATLLKIGQNAPVHYYMTNDESINSEVANFLNLNQITIEGIKVENEKELISSIKKDPYALGFCKMINLVDYKNQSIVEDIKLLPIDRNGNGKIDYIEKIYDDLNVLSRGVWAGKYPKTLFNNIYAISSVKPTNDIEVEFLKWVVTDGQQFLNPTGYSELILSERQRKLDKLYENISDEKINISTLNNKQAISKRILKIVTIGLLVFLIAVLIEIVVVKLVIRKKKLVRDSSSIFQHIFDENSVTIPKGLYYDKTHTWAFMEKNGVVRIGIDDFLPHITGPLTYIKMKNPGEKIKKGDQLLSIIHKGKQIHINAPISGTIKSQNETLITNSSIVNSSPYSNGWVYMIEPTNWLREIQFLIMEKKYKEWLKNEFSRLKDFLAVSVKSNNVAYAHVLQDGSELKDGIQADLGPEVWEDFLTNFIDTAK